MPLVFVTDAPTLWESNYADVVGVQYEFPVRYRNLVVEGDRFLYYRGSRGAALGVGYFGQGVVGKIGSGVRADHLLAAVHDVSLYAEPIAIKDSDGNYLETGSTTGTNWANGVRRIDDVRFDSIAQLAASQKTPHRSFPAFADPAHASAMERYSVAVVLDLLRAEFGGSDVREMPVNNPGFDIEVLRPGDDLHVEVKGTVLPTASFHLSEGQRSHAITRAENWRLYVVYGIDVANKSHQVSWCSGGQLQARANLVPAAWSGTLSAGRAGVVVNTPHVVTK